MEVLVQANAVLTRSNSAAMAQLVQLNTIMGVMQAHLKTLSSSVTTRPKLNTTVGAAVETYPMVSRHLQPRGTDTKINYIIKIVGERERGCE